MASRASFFSADDSGGRPGNFCIHLLGETTVLPLSGTTLFTTHLYARSADSPHRPKNSMAILVAAFRDSTYERAAGGADLDLGVAYAVRFRRTRTMSASASTKRPPKRPSRILRNDRLCQFDAQPRQTARTCRLENPSVAPTEKLGFPRPKRAPQNPIFVNREN